MRWHDKERVKDGLLRHPADAKAWEDFDVKHSDFALGPRNVRLGLTSDGFNPYRLMNTTYSTWPVVLIPYNLPPWLCMKPPSFILSTIIPGKSGLGIDIDVYLQPLVQELKLLWSGVDAFDAYSGEKFNLRAALLWTSNDFPVVSFLRDAAKREKFCPIGLTSWHKLKEKLKVDIVILVRADSNDKVKENLASSSSNKSKVDIENEVFNDLMYNGEVPHRPINYSFGVKRSDIFGVQSLLRARTEGSSNVSNSMVEVESLKNELSTVKKQNEHLNQKNQALEIKVDETALTFKAIASHLAQVLTEVHNGNSSAQLLDGVEATLNLISSQIPGLNDKS